MDKNSIIGMVVIGVLFIGYYFYSKPNQKQLEEAKRLQDSVMLVHQQEMVRMQKNIVSPDTTREKVKLTNTDSTAKQAKIEKYGAFASAANDSNEYITLENNLLKIKFCSRGGRPYSVELKKYTRYDSSPLILFDGDSTILGLSFFSQNKLIETNNLTFLPTTARKQIIVG